MLLLCVKRKCVHCSWTWKYVHDSVTMLWWLCHYRIWCLDVELKSHVGSSPLTLESNCWGSNISQSHVRTETDLTPELVNGELKLEPKITFTRASVEIPRASVEPPERVSGDPGGHLVTWYSNESVFCYRWVSQGEEELEISVEQATELSTTNAKSVRLSKKSANTNENICDLSVRSRGRHPARQTDGQCKFW